MTIPSGRFVVLAAASALALRCGFAAAQAAPAAEPPLTLPAAIELAIGSHPALRAAAHDVAASSAAIEQARQLPNPELSYLREGRDAGTRTTTIQLNQPIELGGKRRARVALAQAGLDVAVGERQARRQALRADVIAAYFDVLAASERAALAEQAAKLAERSADVVSRRVAAGKASPVDAARARLVPADARIERDRAATALAIARQRLEALTGLTVADRTLQAPQLPVPTALPAAPDRAERAPAVRRAGRELALQQARVDVERAARVPDLTLTVGSQRDDQVARRQAVVGVAIPLPLFNRNAGNVVAARERAAQAQAQLEAARLEARSALAVATLQYTQARDEAALLAQTVVPDAQHVYESTLKGFEYGKFAFLDVLDAQRTLLQARTRQLQALHDAWRARAELEQLNGDDGEQP
ncbi:TolC family protein [Pseudoduganella chitinolytica]|uniref:TolC family protein n=1 Tax=Pseudoduganella chitinolytica TaxID=34070 RepID=A0ABY8BHX0_9BURK|nr:TolC family protein [Pseudoduganella chitinolytica]WEF34521.1 TolC family protein [Pseudoduganella chitinolytica]